MLLGDMVLFRVDEHALRPLLVTGTHGVDPEGAAIVSGTLFLQPDDLSSWWVRNRCKLIPSHAIPQAQVVAALAGDEIGQYLTRKES